MFSPIWLTNQRWRQQTHDLVILDDSHIQPSGKCKKFCRHVECDLFLAGRDIP